MSRDVRIVPENETNEVCGLLQSIYQRSGFDFRDYAQGHLRRRIRRRAALSGLASIAELHQRLLVDQQLLQQLLRDLSITVSAMFRNPSFYRALKKEIIPILRTYPFFKIWHAGCATGEEVYSMAILLKEEGLYQRSRIYATDFNAQVLQKARQAIYPMNSIKDFTGNYQQAGGMRSLADYYTAGYDSVVLDRSLREKVLFADHNLVTDGVFGEMNLIICRNVLIYFNRDLQERVLTLFQDSLCPGGFLCLGPKESMKFSGVNHSFSETVHTEKIFQKKLGI